MTRRTLAAWLLAAASVGACAAYDPLARAADPKRALALLFGIVAVGLLLAFDVPARRTVMAARAATLFVAWSAVSAWWGGALAPLVLAPWCGAISLGMAASALEPPRAEQLAVRVAGLLGGGVSVLVLSAVLLGQRGFSLHAGQGNPNWTGLLLAVAWPLACARFEVATPVARLGRVAFSGLFFCALLLTESRAGVVAGFAAWGVVALVATTRAARWHAVSHCGALALVVAWVLAWQPATSANDVEGSLRGRAWIQGVSARLVSEAPFSGVGLGHFPQRFLDQQGRELAQLAPAVAARRFSNANTAHNDWLQVCAESGALAGGLLLASFVLAFRSAARTGFAGGAAALTAFGVAGLADSPLYTPAPVLLLGLVVAALPGSSPGLDSGRELRGVRVAVLLACALLLPRAAAAWLSERERTLALDNDPQRRLELLERSTRLDPSSGEAALAFGAALAVSEPERATPQLIRATQLLGDVSSWLALGTLRLTRDEPGRALIAFEHALSLNGGSVRAHSGSSQALLRLERYAEAERHARIARSLQPGDANLRSLVDRIASARADAELGLPATEK